MINKSCFFGKLRKVLASVCSLVVGASGVSQAGKSFSDALSNKKWTIAHFKFGNAEDSAKGTTKEIFNGLGVMDNKEGIFKGLLNGVCGAVTADCWGYSSYSKIDENKNKLPNGAGVYFSCSDGYVNIKLIHDNVGDIYKVGTANVLRLSLDDFDYIIGKYQKDRLKGFIEEFKEVSGGFKGNSLIEFLNYLRNRIEQRNIKKKIKSVADLRGALPYRYCASILALDLFSYIFGMDLNLKNPDEPIGEIFNNKYDYVELSSGVHVLRPEVFQDAFIRRWGCADGKPFYELAEEIDSVCTKLGVDTSGTVGDKLTRLTEKANALVKNGEQIAELQKAILNLESQLKDAGEEGKNKEQLQKELDEARGKLAVLDPTVSELNEIDENLKDYGGVSRLDKVKKLLDKVTKLNNDFNNLQNNFKNLQDENTKLKGTKFGKVVKLGGYPGALAAGYLINKFIPKGGKKLNNVNKVENKNKNKVENKNKNKGPNRDKKAKKRNNVKKN